MGKTLPGIYTQAPNQHCTRSSSRIPNPSTTLHHTNHSMCQHQHQPPPSLTSHDRTRHAVPLHGLPPSLSSPLTVPLPLAHVSTAGNIHFAMLRVLMPSSPCPPRRKGVCRLVCPSIGGAASTKRQGSNAGGVCCGGHPGPVDLPSRRLSTDAVKVGEV